MKIKILLLLIALFVLDACSVLKANPAKDAGFLPRPSFVQENQNRAPFNAFWEKDAEEFSKLRKEKNKIYIASIDTSVVEKQIKAAEKVETIATDRVEEAETLASYFQNVLKLKFKNHTPEKLKILEEANKDALKLQLALTEIVPTDPGINIIGTVAGLLVPGGGLIGRFGSGSIAMEGYISQVATPQDILEMEFRDREGQKTRPFSVKNYQKYAHLREIIDEWAEQIVAIYFSQPDETIDDSSAVSLNPF